MPAAIHLHCQPHLLTRASYIDRSDTLRSINLVAAKRHQIDIHVPDIDRNLPDCLSSIGVEVCSSFMTQFPDPPDVLDGADLVVRSHDRYKNRLRSECIHQLIKVDQTI